jgi:hypothetical protein
MTCEWDLFLKDNLAFWLLFFLLMFQLWYIIKCVGLVTIGWSPASFIRLRKAAIIGLTYEDTLEHLALPFGQVLTAYMVTHNFESSNVLWFSNARCFVFLWSENWSQVPCSLFLFTGWTEYQANLWLHRPDLVHGRIQSECPGNCVLYAWAPTDCSTKLEACRFRGCCNRQSVSLTVFFCG